MISIPAPARRVNHVEKVAYIGRVATVRMDNLQGCPADRARAANTSSVSSQYSDVFVARTCTCTGAPASSPRDEKSRASPTALRRMFFATDTDCRSASLHPLIDKRLQLFQFGTT